MRIRFALLAVIVGVAAACQPVTPPPGLTLQLPVPATATVGDVYAAQLKVSGGRAPYQYSVVNGSAIVESGGRVRGVVDTEGDNPIEISVTDSRGRTGSATFTIMGRRWEVPLGFRTVYRSGEDIVVDGPDAGQRTRHPFPGIEGWVEDASSDGRWVQLTWGSRDFYGGYLVDLTGVVPPITVDSCGDFSPGGRWVVCWAARNAAAADLYDLRDGTHVGLTVGQLYTSWSGDSTLVTQTYDPNGSGVSRLASVRIDPLGTPVDLGVELAPYSVPVGALTDGTVIVSDQGALSSIRPGGVVTRLTRTDASDCVLDQRGGLFACRRLIEDVGPTVPDNYARFVFPASTTIDLIDARTGQLFRSVTRSDCVLTPLEFTPAGELAASCAPWTASRIGRSEHVVPGDGPMAGYYDLLRYAGTETVITPFTGLWRDIPKLAFDTALVA